MHIYESHLGGFYSVEDELDYVNLYCDTCGDSDQYQCEVNSKQDVKDFIESLPDWYDRDYINELKEEWEAKFDELEP